MKIRQLLLVSLLGLPLIACGKSAPSYKVNEKEFYSAVQFKEVSYMQYVFLTSKEKTENRYSPNAYDEINYSSETDEIETETRVFKYTTIYEKYHYNNGNWTHSPTTEFDFGSIEKIGKEFMEELKSMSVKFDDSMYDSKRKAYCFEIEDNDNNGKVEIEMYFKNKKFIKMIKNEIGSSNVVILTFSYEKIDIEVPKVPSWGNKFN